MLKRENEVSKSILPPFDFLGNGLRPDIWADFQSRFGIKDIR